MVRKPTPEGGTYAERIAREKGAKRFGPPDVDYFNAKEMLGWLESESYRVMKEAQLRTRDATAFVTAYARGEISQKEANDRMSRYDKRWSEALDGIPNPERMTDDHILSTLDRRMASYLRQEASGPKDVKRTPPKGGKHVERVRRQGDSRAERLELDSAPLRTADEMLRWLKAEVYAVTREADLRIRDATSIAIDYASGQISQKEANDRSFLYSERWPEALDGMYTPERMTDEQILRELDQRMASYRRGTESGKPPSR